MLCVVCERDTEDLVAGAKEATSAFNQTECLHLLIFNDNARLELLSLEGLAELPPGRCHVVAGDRPAVAGSHLEREALPVQVRVALPVLAPVARHPLPPCLRPLYRHRVHVAGRAHVGDQHQDEVGVAIDVVERGCPPAEGDRDDASTVLRDLEEGGLGEVEMLPWRVTPSAVVAGEGVVRRAEVGSRDDNRAREAPPGVIGAPHLVASAAAEPIVEERSAEGRGVGPVPLAVEVAIATSPACNKSKPTHIKMRMSGVQRSFVSNTSDSPIVPEASPPP
ncbi:unnamed protein product [Musa banksii]